ncbi:MAG: ATP-dependent DNA ligase [Methanomassiliicoccales archaeon]|nr:MAG: ATP-dependent DNA ligase [Methanomassiliicoccales archaeon]
MLFSELAEVYRRLDSTTSRLEMAEILASFFKGAEPSALRRSVYLTQGQLYPDFYPQKLGMADKLLIRTLASVIGVKEQTIQELQLKEGDLGSVAEQLYRSKRQQTLFSEPLTLDRVYSALEKVSVSEGGGSQDSKMKQLADILHDASPIEAKYICRMVTGKMRLGVASMTVIDALAIAFASKEERDVIERAFNITSDLGMVAETLSLHGLEGVRALRVKVGNPIRAMLAERMSSPAEILEKMGGACAFEYKYDGVRVQAHIDKGKVKLYSRRLEDLTGQFPDVVSAIKASFTGSSAIVEGECVPIDINTGEFLPFQEVSHRRGRKHGLDEAMEEYPVRFCLFDLLYLDGKDMTEETLLKRRAALASCFSPNDQLRLSEMRVLDNEEAVQEFFMEAVRDGCEGLMAKSIGPDSVYRAGNRGFLWIKYKKEYRSELNDTVDLVVVGAFAGRGKRKGLYGALLMATYNEEEDRFETVSKLGSGFDDAELAKMVEVLEKFRVPEKHHQVSSKMQADYWFEPGVVLEVLGAEITVSPIHTAAFGAVRKDAGLAIRFPRFTGRIRDDKGPRESTTSKELLEMYKMQLKRIDE